MKSFTGLVPTLSSREQWTLPAVLRHRAGTHGDRIYLDVPDEGLRVTYADMLATAEQTATHLLALDGVAAGDRMLIMAANGSPYLFGWFGAALAGLVEVPINTAYRGAFLEHQVRTVEPTVAIIDAEFAERFAESRQACGSIRHIFVIGEADAVEAAAAGLEPLGCTVQPFAQLLETVTIGSLPAVRPEQLASVFFTSGTTGLSKGVMMPHAHMYFFADECVALTRLGDDDTYASVGPLFHGNAQFLAAYPALIAGARFVLGRRFSASGWLSLMRDSAATVTNFVGVMMDFVWKQPVGPDDADNALRCIFAAPTAWSILEGFRERFGIEAFVEVFGLTETAMPILSPYGSDRPAGAAGLLAEEWFEVRLVDPDTDDEVPTGEVGELTVRPKAPWTTFLGYYGMPDRTVEAWRNQWIHTGDGMRRDFDGWYYFVDRLKDSIRRRGENISSYEVEQAILPHAGVAEVAVVAVPAAVEAGEDEVMAYVVAAGEPPSPGELWSWCEERLPYFAVPRYLAFVDELPKTPSEKVRKIELRERAGSVERFDREAARTR
jgi:crotonobetaine/carnitine-CoA ligase